MSKIFHKYDNVIDKTWYESSNILYSECDESDTTKKTLRIIFNNGKMYEYSDVDVHDYLFFRDAESQGKAFNKYIRKYEYKKLDDNVNTKLILEELDIEQNPNKNYCFEFTCDEFKLFNRENLLTRGLLNKDNINAIENIANALKIRINRVG